MVSSFFTQYGDYIFYAVALVLYFIQLIRTNSTKKAVNNLKDIYMQKKYKTAYDNNKVSQAFSKTVPDYVLNVETNELERSPVDKDLQDYIQSFADVAIQNAIEKFLPKVIEDDDKIADYTSKREDLAVIGEAMDRAEYYREKYNLPSSYSVREVYDFVQKQADELKANLHNVKKSKQEVADNEKKA